MQVELHGGIYSESTIKGCFNSANIKLQKDYNNWGPIGGICGYISGNNTKIENCYNKGTITAIYVSQNSDIRLRWGSWKL